MSRLRRLSLSFLVVFLVSVSAPVPVSASASDEEGDAAHWIRYPAISPDGTTIVFSWRGDLWTVPVEGGEATALTRHAAYEAWPAWSPDSQRIAFASDRHGQLDVFVTSREGGTPARLTWHSADDVPSAFDAAGERIYFSSDRQHSAAALLASGRFEELYSVPADGSARPRQELTTPALEVDLDAAGRVVYEERTAYENEWRKHQTSSAARDLWTWDPSTGEHRKITTFEGEDRDPLWIPEGATERADFETGVLYLSEQDGTLDVWHLPLGPDGDAGEPVQVTEHGPHPVRFPSVADDGTLAYSYHGAIWLRTPDGTSREVEVSLRADDQRNAVVRRTETEGATEMAASPYGDEVAFVIRGDVFVTSVEHGTTRRLTSTPEQERSVAWAPDGRSLYYASERMLDGGRVGSWNLYRLGLVHDDEERFFLATETREEPVLVGEDETFQPVVSPDGTTLAYLHNRDEIRLLDLESGESRVLVPAERNYSYADGDIHFAFSPDGRWLAADYYGYERWVGEVGLVEVATGEIHNVTESGYAEYGGVFSADGETLFYVSDRFGERAHGSWGGEADAMAVSLTREAWDEARMSLEEWERMRERREERERKERGEEDADGDDGKGDDGPDELPESADPVDVETDDLLDRTRRFSLHSASLGASVPSKDGEAIFYLARVDDRLALWAAHPRRGETRRVVELGNGGGRGGPGGDLELSADGETLFVLTPEGKLMHVDVEGFTRVGDGRNGDRGGNGGRGGGDMRAEAIPFRAELEIDRRAERAHLFEHVWRQVKRKFYVEDLHGADWEGLKAAYEPFVADLRHDRDFAEMLSELLGELNASHTGARYRPRHDDGAETASLGLLYDLTHGGPGLVVDAVLDRGPADHAGGRIEPGTTITEIDGVELARGVNPWRLLDGKEGEKVRVALQNDGEAWEEVLEPISLGDEDDLRYERWIERLRQRTDELSDGRVGYVHVQSMNDRSFRRFYRDALGTMSDKEALVVDTRWNGGGWLHDDLAAFLQGELYLTFVPRGKEPGSLGGESAFRWTRPAAVLQNEANYSDGHIGPWVIQHLGLAPLVGAPVAGTGTAVWWERLINPDLVFGIPQVGMLDNEGRYMENQQLEPDVLVYNSPETVAEGGDDQLEAAVRLLLENSGQSTHQ